MKTKKGKQYNFEHTQLRILQRYHIKISMDDYDYLCHRIRYKMDVTLIDVEKQKNDTQYIYDLKIDLLPKIRVVWSNKKDRITTVLKRK